MAGEGLAAASFGLNRFGSKITSKLPGPLQDAVGLGLNFRRFKEPQLSYKWEFKLPKLNFADITVNEAADIDQINAGNVLGDFVPTVVGVTVPFTRYEKEDVYVSTSQYHLPTSNSSGTLSLKILQESDGKALYYFEYWKDMIKDSKGRYRYSSEYKRDLTCTLLNYTNGELNTIQLGGCFPVAINDLGLTYDSSEAMYFDVEFSVDIVPLHTLHSSILSANNLFGAAKSAINKIPGGKYLTKLF